MGSIQRRLDQITCMVKELMIQLTVTVRYCMAAILNDLSLLYTAQFTIIIAFHLGGFHQLTGQWSQLVNAVDLQLILYQILFTIMYLVIFYMHALTL